MDRPTAYYAHSTEREDRSDWQPLAEPPKDVRRYHVGFIYQAGTWDEPRRVVAKVKWHPGELYTRGGLIVTNLSRLADRVVAFCNPPGTAERWIKEGKNTIGRTRLSCRRFDHNAVRLQLHALAYNLADFMRTIALPNTFAADKQKDIKGRVDVSTRFAAVLRLDGGAGHRFEVGHRSGEREFM